jgi:hypothetical protein
MQPGFSSCLVVAMHVIGRETHDEIQKVFKSENISRFP